MFLVSKLELTPNVEIANEWLEKLHKDPNILHRKQEEFVKQVETGTHIDCLHG
jgi:hypothetical protein